MSDHSHTHGPNQEPCHGHGPPPQSPAMAPANDPATQAAIDQEFVAVPLALSDPNTAVCDLHKLEKCDQCNVDFVNTNRLAKLLANNPALLCPPPNNVVTQQLSAVITRTKDEGNALFKQNQSAQAVARYTLAANYAVQRPPWEPNQVMREELSTVVSNRSAAYWDLGDYISALADAETVISLRRNWPKGHFRKAKALLAMQKLAEAADAVRLGLSFEPQNTELMNFLRDIETIQEKIDEKRALQGSDATTPIKA